MKRGFLIFFQPGRPIQVSGVVAGNLDLSLDVLHRGMTGVTPVTGCGDQADVPVHQ